jgi:hypothetical protein
MPRERRAETLQWPLRVVSDEPDPQAPGQNLTTQDVQGTIEGAVELDDENSLEFLGKRFRLAERIGLMPMLAFAAASKKGLDSSDMEGLAAMYALIRDCLDQTRTQATDADGELVFEPDGTPRYVGASQWQLFENHCNEVQAGPEELMEFISSAMSVVSARPPKRRETSSGGSPQTLPKSKEGSSLRATWPRTEELTDVRELGH